MHVSVMSGPYWDGSERLMADWGSSGRRFKSCQPDGFVQFKLYFYVLPLLAAWEHLIRVEDGRESPHLIFGANAGLNCGFCPESETRTAATSSRRVVTRRLVGSLRRRIPPSTETSR